MTLGDLLSRLDGWPLAFALAALAACVAWVAVALIGLIKE
jgi:hypothetical protein